MPVHREVFGRTAAGEKVEAFIITNAHGFEATFINYGAAIVSIKTPDRNGTVADVVLGYDNVAGYELNNPYIGVCCGRYANRIAKGKFVLDGVEYQLAINNGPNHLHGGELGFDQRLWEVVEVGHNEVTFKLVSPDGEDHYPGTLTALLTYHVTNENAVEIRYSATTDKLTVCNLTNHSYFNLTGVGGKHYNHLMQINADRYTVVDEHNIPTGELRDVANGPMDFRTPSPIGARIAEVGIAGYDHNWCLNKKTANELSLAAKVVEPVSGRTLECWTTEPGVQFYAGFYLGKVAGKNNAIYDSHEAFCLETQKYPDSPNNPSFPPATLAPGEEYRHTCIYKFGVDA